MKLLYGKFPLSILTILFLTQTFTGQDLDGISVSVAVTDLSGALIRGASVTAAEGASGARRSTLTDQNGRYRIIGLNPGSYSITVISVGFQTETRSLAEAFSGQSIRLDISLRPAGIRAARTVAVGAGARPVIDAKRTVVGSTVSGSEAEELPNASNDVLDLAYILGGIAEEPFSIRNLADDDRIGGGSGRDRPGEVTGAGSVSLAGGAAYSTNFTIDGLDDNDDRSADARFQPPAGSVAEIQVVTNQFSSEYGRASGGRINVRTRSGGRRAHGRLFIHFEDESLNANTYNNNRRGIGRLPYTEYNAGGTLSGPVPHRYFRGRTFFFSAYSYKNRNATSLIDTVVPLAQNPAFPVPPPTNPRESRVDDIPDPRSDTFPEVLIAPYRAIVATPKRRYKFLQKIDHHFDDLHNITISYQAGRSLNFRQYRETTRFLRETLQGTTRRNRSLSVTDNYVIGSRTVNRFRFQMSAHRPDFAAAGALDPVVLLFVSDDSRSGRTDQVRGTVVIGNSTSNFASLRRESRIQLQDTLTVSFGRHDLRAGIDNHRIDSRNTKLRDATGTFNFSRVYDFLTGRPSRYRRRFGNVSILKNIYVGAFLQDEWNPAAGLTVNAGLRYAPESIVSDRNNFGPRLALAFSPGDNGKTVFRIGAGVLYNRALLRTLDDHRFGSLSLAFDSETLAGPSNERKCLDQREPVFANTDKCRFLAMLGRGFPNPPGLVALRGMLAELGIGQGGFVTKTNFSRLVENGIRIPESYQFNVGFERGLGGGVVLEANLTFNKTVRLWRETNINAFRVPTGFRTMTDYLLSLDVLDLRGGPTRFELGERTDRTGVRFSDGVRIVNLATSNGSEANASPIGIAFEALGETLERPYSKDLGQVEQVSSIGRSVYEGLSVSVRRRFRRSVLGFGTMFRVSYVLSRTRDDGFVDTSSAQVAGDFRNEFGASGIDRRHKFRLSGVLEFPARLGKLRAAPILRIESARPFNISIGGSDRNLDDVGNDRPNYLGDPDGIRSRSPGDPFPEALAASFSLSPIGTPGDLRRNAGRGPSLFIFDMSLSRSFRFLRRFSLRPQVVIGNVLNARVFSFGSDFINLSKAGSPEFAQGFLVPTRTLKQRKVQLRVTFGF